jgi:hypothetical protein
MCVLFLMFYYNTRFQLHFLILYHTQCRMLPHSSNSVAIECYGEASITPSVAWDPNFRGTTRLFVCQMLCEMHFVYKFLRCCICTVASGPWVVSTSKFIFALDWNLDAAWAPIVLLILFLTLLNKFRRAGCNKYRQLPSKLCVLSCSCNNILK